METVLPDVDVLDQPFAIEAVAEAVAEADTDPPVPKKDALALASTVAESVADKLPLNESVEEYDLETLSVSGPDHMHSTCTHLPVGVGFHPVPIALNF